MLPASSVDRDPGLSPAQPASVDELGRAVEELGARLAGCKRQCQGIKCDVSRGFMPRCVIFEPRGCDTLDRGVIVIGMNPGQADNDERELIKRLFRPEHDPEHAYAEYLAWLMTAVQRIPFYTLMRAALVAMRFTGPILWTEIVKCESGEAVITRGRTAPVSFSLGPPFRETTVRTCRNAFLRAELALCPHEWPIVAAGLGVGDYLNKTRDELAGKRPIVAVPHPTGSEDFLKVFIPSTLTTSAAVVDRVHALGHGRFERLSNGPRDR